MHCYESGQRITERTTGTGGVIVERKWIVDLRSTTPATPAYVVRFDDGRRKDVQESEIEAQEG